MRAWQVSGSAVAAAVLGLAAGFGLAVLAFPWVLNVRALDPRNLPGRSELPAALELFTLAPAAGVFAGEALWAWVISGLLPLDVLEKAIRRPIGRDLLWFARLA